MKGTSWDDLACFAAVARLGSLGKAAEALGTSEATLSRRMHRLEAQMGRRLFIHGKAGYQLTGDGRALKEKAQSMEASAADIARWTASAQGPVCVRISAGTWTATYLAENIRSFWEPNPLWLPEFVQCDAMMDIARREVDIGIRNVRPDHPWLAGQQTGLVTFAAYATSPNVTGWIGPSQDAPQTASGRWIWEHNGADVVTKANEPHLACAMAQGGLGRVILPTFMGDGIKGLQRVSDPIEELSREEWLVSHHEARHDAPIRAAIEALAQRLREKNRAGG